MGELGTYYARAEETVTVRSPVWFHLHEWSVNAERQSRMVFARGYEHLKRPWCWESLKAGGKGDDTGRDGWMASLTQWTWVWINSGSWWWTGRPGVLQSKGSQSWTWLSEWTNTQKRCPFHYRGLECKSRKSKNTWRNRQIWPWNTEWSRAKTNRVLPRKRTDHSKHPLPTTQEKTLHMDITRWSTPKSGWLYSLQPKIEKLYTVSKNKTGSWLWLRSWAPYCQIQT